MSDKAEKIQKKREERKAELERQRVAQYEIDLEALDAAEVEHGDSNVAAVHFEFIPGLPTLAVVKTPSAPLMKRFNARLKPSKNQQAGAAAAEATQELAPEVVVYPEASVWRKMVEARPNFDISCGGRAVKLSEASESTEGKG